jgi:hypothetical protein
MVWLSSRNKPPHTLTPVRVLTAFGAAVAKANSQETADLIDIQKNQPDFGHRNTFR